MSIQVTQWVKNLPSMQETQVQALGREDALEEEMASHPSILAWRIPGQRSLVGCIAELDMVKRLGAPVSMWLMWSCRGLCTLAAIGVDILEVLNFLASLQISLFEFKFPYL